MKVLGVTLSPYRKRMVSLEDPPPTPARTSSGRVIKPGLIKALDRQQRATVACSDEIDRAICAARRVLDSVPPPEPSPPRPGGR